jgi:membrane-bound serine protease (ClpP class)
MLIGAEIFVPGGVLGVFGALALIGAMITGFFAFPGYGPHVATAIIFGLGVVLVLWIKIFPKTRIGRSMTVEMDLGEAKGTEEGLETLLDKVGDARSDLRPGGFAIIDGRRIDVVTQGEMISKGARVRVVEVEGNRVVVSKVAEQA